MSTLTALRDHAAMYATMSRSREEMALPSLKAFEQAIETMGFYRAEVTRIKIDGEEFLFIGDPARTNGAIATREQYENFEESFAHLHADGNISRFGACIGTRDDIEWSTDTYGQGWRPHD